ncbi:uncharacterized protein LAESUDRAFT_662434, partial [Laetiporus sulphureus 93-53]
ILIKFTRSYFVQLHDFCTARGHAPKLLGCGVVPGDWKVVVMEWIDQDEELDHASAHLSTWSKDLKKLVNDFHAHRCVHGDLRAANLIVCKTKPEQVQLIDFDWAGDLNSGQVHLQLQSSTRN